MPGFRASIVAIRRPGVLVALRALAALMLLGADAACAHAIVVTATPAAHSTVAAGTLEIRLDFNSAIDRRRSSLKLTGPDGIESPVALTDSGPGTLAGRANATVSGSWTLHWQVLSRDGHITRGDILFLVRDAADSPVH